MDYKPKALFFGGISGSGKTSYANLIKRLAKPEFVNINSDKFAEPMLAEIGLLKMKGFDIPNDPDLKTQTEILKKAKELVADNIEKALEKRKNIIIDATSRSIEEITVKKQELEKLGYETFFILVISDLKTAIERNNTRERSLHANTIRAMYKQNEENLKYEKYKNLFKNNYLFINNNTTTNIIEFERIVRSNHPIKDSIDNYNKKVITKALSWCNKKTPQNIEVLTRNITNSILDKGKIEKFKSSIKKIKESYQFRV